MTFVIIVVRNYVKTSNRRNYTPDSVVAAVLAVRNGMSLRNAERQYGVPARTVGRRRLLQDKAGVDPAEILLSGRPVFSKDEEQQLESYLLTASDRLIGLCRPELRSLAFDYAQRLSKPHKFNSIQQKAGYQWIHGFMRRNPIVSIRIPQATSIYRAKAFTKEKVDVFFDNLDSVMTTYNFEAESIWNMDETGLSIVQKPLPVIARRGTNSVGRVTSGERGRLMTAIYCCSATGKYLPPFLVFPGRKFNEGMLRDAPRGTDGTCTPTGWSNQEVFVKWLSHFIEHSDSSTQKPSLLLLDNHTSHITYDAINMCMEHGITLLSLPPHCSHKLQPLDVSVFKGFKASLRTAQHMWLSRNAPKRITEKTLPQLFTQAYEASSTRENAVSGFRCTGISPYDRNIFKPEEFVASEIFGNVVSNNYTENSVIPSTSTAGTSNQLPNNETEYERDLYVSTSPEHTETEVNNEPLSPGSVIHEDNEVEMDISNGEGNETVEDMNDSMNYEDQEKQMLEREKDLLVRKKALFLQEKELLDLEVQILNREKALLQRNRPLQTERTDVESGAQSRRVCHRKPVRLTALTKTRFFSDLHESQITPHTLRPLPTAGTSSSKPRSSQMSKILTTPEVRAKLQENLQKKISKSKGESKLKKGG